MRNLADLEDIARPVIDAREAAHRKAGRTRIRTESGVAIGWAIWREELDRSDCVDDRWKLAKHRPTLAQCESLVRKIVAAESREEAKKCR